MRKDRPNSKLETFRGKAILQIDRLPADEKAIIITSCPTILAQIILRDRRIRELEQRLAQLEKDTLVQQNLIPDLELPAD